MSCQYAPLSILKEEELQIELGVSRTPIREAIITLETERLVKILPKKGILVTDITMNDVNSIFEVRTLLESYAIEKLGVNVAKEKLLEFLQKETFGYHIITVGSSAGAYAAILYGSILQAEKVIAFNPQFELSSLLERSSEQINPLLFRLKNSDRNRYFDITSFINKNIDIFYFYSNKSQWDIEQNHFLRNKNIKSIHQIPFSSKHHGIPFLKVALPIVLNLETKELKKYTKHIQNPLLFTIKMVGITKTLVGFWQQIYQSYRKRH